VNERQDYLFIRPSRTSGNHLGKILSSTDLTHSPTHSPIYLRPLKTTSNKEHLSNTNKKNLFADLFSTMVHLSTLLGAATLATFALSDSASAHPGQQQHVKSAAEIAHRKLFHANAQRSLKACANSPHARKLQERTVAHRAAKVQQLRQEQAARRRLAAADVLATSHKTNLTDVTVDTDPTTLFGTDPKCILEPEVTQGPYYVSGELIRNDIRETQAGVDLYAEIQFIDVNTCTPVEDYYVDFWHCNSTGVYAGVVASGNGDSSDLTNVNKTFNRGLAPTDADGLVNFITTFPGHYTSRATHIHILGQHDGTVLANNTYSGGKAASVGQLFFDQDLLTEVEATSAYNVNKQPVTLNSADSIFAEETASGFDPVMEYALLGDSVEDGVFAWISVGVDMTISKTVSGAATLTADGGVMNSSNGVSGGGGGGNGPSGSMGGAPPSGSGFGGGSMGAPPSGSMGGAPASSEVTAPTTASSTSSSSAASEASTTSAPSACVQSRRV
jgi:protocatechuate 3,4-dioxygenase beta subunit